MIVMMMMMVIMIIMMMMIMMMMMMMMMVMMMMMITIIMMMMMMMMIMMMMMMMMVMMMMMMMLIMMMMVMMMVQREEEVGVQPGAHNLLQFTQHIYIKEAQEDQGCTRCFESHHQPGESPQCDSNCLLGAHPALGPCEDVWICRYIEDSSCHHQQQPFPQHLPEGLASSPCIIIPFSASESVAASWDGGVSTRG